MLFVLSKYDMKIYSDQDMWDWQKDRHVDQWNRNESPEINTDLYSQLMTNKAANAIQWGKQGSFQWMVLRQLDIHIQKDELRNLPHAI